MLLMFGLEHEVEKLIGGPLQRDFMLTSRQFFNVRSSVCYSVKSLSVILVIMILRVHALYRRSLPILAFLWMVQIVISAIGLHTGFSEFLIFKLHILIL